LRTLGHHGVLFLDEFTEFRRDAIEGLRQPLEDGRVVVTRMVGSVVFPARFTLDAALLQSLIRRPRRPRGVHGPLVRGALAKTQQPPDNPREVTDIPPAPPPRGAIPPQASLPPRSPRMWPWIAGIVGAIVLIVIGALRANNQEPGTSDIGTDGSSSVVVTYVVSGDSRQADVTYQNRNGDTPQESGVSLPWEYGFATTSAFEHFVEEVMLRPQNLPAPPPPVP
jgi:Magnesium chelatase, subunit ChlI